MDGHENSSLVGKIMAPAPASKINQIVHSVENLRPIPTSVSRVMMMLDDPSSTARDISEMIGMDQALAATVLQMANSVALGFSPACANLKDAVMRLGFKRIKTVVMGAGVSGSLNKSLTGYRYGYGVLWNHSIAVATAAQWLSQALQYPDPDEAYVAGLLHDMGKLMLDQYVQIDYAQMVDMMKRYRQPLQVIEEKLFGIDHASVGGMMAQKWNFPVTLVDTIRFHHAPSLVRTNSPLAAIINLANAFDPQDMHGLSSDKDLKIHPEALNILHLDIVQVERLRERMHEYFKVGLGNQGQG